MRILICGLGSAGRRHLRNLQQFGQQEIALYRTGQSTLPEAELEGFPTYSGLEQALDDFKPQAAVVANPTALHLPVAIAAARAGCHLLLEKPVSHSLDQIDEFTAALQAGGGRVLVGYQFRFDAGLRRIKQLLEENRLGSPLYARAHWGEYLPGWHPWEDYQNSYSARADLGGGVLLTLSHAFDYLGWMLGEAISLTATASRIGDLEIDVDSLAEVTALHPAGVVSSVHLNYLERPKRHTLRVVCSEGGISWDAEDGQVDWWSEDTEGWQHAPAPSGYTRDAMFLEEVRHFLAVVDGSETPACTLVEGIYALRVALAAAQSAATGSRAVVREIQRMATN